MEKSIIEFLKQRGIDEGNLYRVIIKSRLSTSRKFENWVCEEVLPSIRKYGKYTLKEDAKGGE